MNADEWDCFVTLIYFILKFHSLQFRLKCPSARHLTLKLPQCWSWVNTEKVFMFRETRRVIFQILLVLNVGPVFLLRHSVGDTKQPFCLQSCVKPLQYAIAVHEAGTEMVHRYVGMEPSGLKFNMLSLDDEGVWKKKKTAMRDDFLTASLL